MGRPKKYTERTLKKAVMAYFAAITRDIALTEKVPTGQKDSAGHEVFAFVPVIANSGEQAQTTEYLEPPTVGGLCAYLGIHRSTWAEYCNNAIHPEMAEITVYAQERMRMYLEQQLLTRKDVRGIVFSLQNNYGYTERREVELGPKASRAVTAANIPIEEREAILQEIAREFGGQSEVESAEGR